MKVIGLTGGIGSGKTSVANKLRRLGAMVFDADEAARQALLPDCACYEKVAAAFGREILEPGGGIKRDVLAAIVFENKERLNLLEGIVHGYVWQQAESFLDECRRRGEKAAVLDIPLLIEKGWHEKMDEVWLIEVSIETQLQRTMKRSGLSEDEVRKRIAAQLPLAEKRRYATVIINNEGTWQETEKQIAAAWEKTIK